jgi:hypothetical protein
MSKLKLSNTKSIDIKDSNNKNISKTVRKSSLVEVTVDYKNRMAEERLRKLHLQNEHQEFDLDKKKDTICYRVTAMSEFEKAISSIYAQIKNADEQLIALLRLTPSQSDVLHTYMESILTDLSNIDINLSSTEQFDADHYFDGAAKKKQMLSN